MNNSYKKIIMAVCCALTVQTSTCIDWNTFCNIIFDELIPWNILYQRETKSIIQCTVEQTIDAAIDYNALRPSEQIDLDHFKRATSEAVIDAMCRQEYLSNITGIDYARELTLSALALYVGEESYEIALIFIPVLKNNFPYNTNIMHCNHQKIALAIKEIMIQRASAALRNGEKINRYIGESLAKEVRALLYTHFNIKT